ncbi:MULTISPECIES: maltokinase N-terminal cap-like domain-containing protein [Streptacidiphilus]|uniref:1,4-alpha-glucan branching protein n=1 Tax=Streptacidiphilus cavernicola TaxID=3342716 RepID=A0ABV6UKX8_9ACTN|nr:hypothetical protein [Streptacidiphilus jeojiense]
MAVVHNTTMTPTKLELLTEWLPRQRWYLGSGRAPELVKAGGFRLDDPEGEVGIEFMVVVDTAGSDPVAYQVPMAYRGAPLDGPEAEAALIGTSEHGVLGTRWLYDGAQDPVVTAQLAALLRGTAVPQRQHESATPDPTVTVAPSPAAAGSNCGIVRVLRPLDNPDEVDADHLLPGRVVAGWTWPDGTTARGLLATTG